MRLLQALFTLFIMPASFLALGIFIGFLWGQSYAVKRYMGEK